MVGDCVGHDLGAATVMGQLRSACRALLLQDASPGQVLAAMDRFAASVTGAEFTTVFCAILEPATGQLTYSAAGHPPAIVAHPDGGVVLLEGARSFPLAAAPHADRQEAGDVLPPRSTLLLYTDGLVERRGHSLQTGSPRRQPPSSAAPKTPWKTSPPGSWHASHRPADTETTWPSCCTGSPLRSVGVPRRHGAAQTSPRPAAPLAGELRPQHATGSGCPGGGRRSGSQRDRARSPRPPRPGDPAPGPPSPRTSCGSPSPTAAAGSRPRTSRPRTAARASR